MVLFTVTRFIRCAPTLTHHELMWTQQRMKKIWYVVLFVGKLFVRFSFVELLLLTIVYALALFIRL